MNVYFGTEDHGFYFIGSQQDFSQNGVKYLWKPVLNIKSA